MANALIGVQHDDNTVTAIECYSGGDLAGAGSTLYSCYSVKAKVEALVRLGSIQQLAASLGDTDFVAGALVSRSHKPLRYHNRNEYARAGANRSQHVYVMQKNGDWRILDGVGTKGNPRWPGLKRVLGERGLRVPGITTRHDDHQDPAVVARIEALVGATPSAPAPAPAPVAVPAGSRDFDEDFGEAIARAAEAEAEREREETEHDVEATGTYEDYADEEQGARGGVTDSIVLVVLDGDGRGGVTGGIAFEEVYSDDRNN